MKTSLQFRQAQQLALTPQLQQSIRLLQMGTLELQQEVELMLEQNPFLEAGEGTGEEALPGLSGTVDTPAADDPDTLAGGDEAPDTPDTLSVLDQGGTPEEAPELHGEDDLGGDAETFTAHSAAPDDDDDPVARAGGHESLVDHLTTQALAMGLPRADLSALMALIHSLDEDGYLADPIEDVAEALEQWQPCAEEGQDWQSRLHCALGWLQHCSPAGVGARDLPECLRLQLLAMPSCPTQALALQLAAGQDGLDALARRDWRGLTQQLKVPERALQAAFDLIRQLEPKPGRRFADLRQQALVPDVIVRPYRRGWLVQLNPEVAPRLHLNLQYASAMKGCKHEAMQQQLAGAKGFLRSLQQRFETIVRVAQAIVDRQKGFFQHGPLAMQPLVLREIAEQLALHESTISRVTNGKYMATPVGTFELKHFFGSGLSTETGGQTSSTAVKERIRQLIAEEDRRKPVSDQSLADVLEKEGICVARRTVAKYREELRIPTAQLRKSRD